MEETTPKISAEENQNLHELHVRLTQLLNSTSMDAFTGMPDYLLSDMLVNTIITQRRTLYFREQWFGRDLNGIKYVAPE